MNAPCIQTLWWVQVPRGTILLLGFFAHLHPFVPVFEGQFHLNQLGVVCQKELGHVKVEAFIQHYDI